MSTTIRIPQVPVVDRQGNMSLEWLLFFQEPQVVEILPGTVLAVESGGTGLQSGTPGGILGFTAPTTIASSAALVANAIVLGGGAGFTPSTPLGLGTTTTVLHGNAAGAPTWGAVSLTTDVTGTLPANRGGTGLASYTIGDILFANSAATLTALPDVATGNALISGGIGVAPAWGKVGLTTHVDGILPVANGGTGVDNTAQTYTPTLTNVANLDDSTAYLCQYMQVGNVVTVSGRVDVDPTAGAAATRLGISLPVASNLANAQECAGTAFCPAIATQGAAILGDTTNNRAQMEWISADTTDQPMYFSFTYQVIA